MNPVRRLFLIFALVFAVGGSACIVHTHGTRREGRSCGKNKVWVRHNGRLQCKHRHFKRGHHHDKSKGKSKGKGKVKKRDHR